MLLLPSYLVHSMIDNKFKGETVEGLMPLLIFKAGMMGRVNV